MAAVCAKGGKFKCKSSINKKRMGSRSTEIRPVGAWVQPEPVTDNEHVFAAVVSAEAEEKRIREHLSRKKERLHRFQADVKKRVKSVEQVRKKQQIEKSYRAMEAERNILCQTMQAAESVMSRKDRCCMRKGDNMKISSTPMPFPDGLCKQKKEVHQVVTRARKTLLSKKIIQDTVDKDEDLPGGPWRTSPTKDHPAHRKGQLPGVEFLGSETLPENLQSENICKTQIQVENERKKVHFGDEVAVKKKQGRRKGKALKEVEVNIRIPELYPGVLGEQLKRQTSTQRALYRRLFMDIEREQVKEMTKKQDHRKRISSLKKVKEAQRKRVEDQANYMIEPRDPVTGETAREMLQREQTDQEKLVNHDCNTRKQVETDRYLDALKVNLQEKLGKKSVSIPPLCSCTDNIWDTDPKTCANNCIFYRNPKGFAKALHSLIASAEV